MGSEGETIRRGAIARVHTDVPEFVYWKKLIDAADIRAASGYPDEETRLCYPTVLDAAQHLRSARARYYLYCSPHDHDPGCGVGLFVSDNVGGPWTFAQRVIAEGKATPSVVYNPEQNKVVVYAHGPNGQNHIYDSDDGVEFAYRGRMDLDPAAQGYGQVFRYALPGTNSRYCGLFWIGFCPPECSYRCHSPYTGLYISEDGYTWECVERDFYPPASEFTGNEGAPALANNPHFTWFGSVPYVFFHDDGVGLWAYKVGEDLRPITYAGLVFHAGKLPSELTYSSVTSPCVLHDDTGKPYLLFGAHKPGMKKGKLLESGMGDVLISRPVEVQE